MKQWAGMKRIELRRDDVENVILAARKRPVRGWPMASSSFLQAWTVHREQRSGRIKLWSSIHG